MATVTIPLTTFQVGLTEFGPFAVGSVHSATIVIDRTVAGGLNSLTSASSLVIEIDTSPDGGVTWQQEVSNAPDGFIGGPVLTKGGGNRNSDSLNVTGISQSPTGRVSVTVNGPASIAVGGSITTA